MKSEFSDFAAFKGRDVDPAVALATVPRESLMQELHGYANR
jgi:hypothetical protein